MLFCLYAHSKDIKYCSNIMLDTKVKGVAHDKMCGSYEDDLDDAEDSEYSLEGVSLVVTSISNPCSNEKLDNVDGLENGLDYVLRINSDNVSIGEYVFYPIDKKRVLDISYRAVGLPIENVSIVIDMGDILDV